MFPLIASFPAPPVLTPATPPVPPGDGGHDFAVLFGLAGLITQGADTAVSDAGNTRLSDPLPMFETGVPSDAPLQVEAAMVAENAPVAVPLPMAALVQQVFPSANLNPPITQNSIVDPDNLADQAFDTATEQVDPVDTNRLILPDHQPLSPMPVEMLVAAAGSQPVPQTKPVAFAAPDASIRMATMPMQPDVSLHRPLWSVSGAVPLPEGPPMRVSEPPVAPSKAPPAAFAAPPPAAPVDPVGRAELPAVAGYYAPAQKAEMPLVTAAALPLPFESIENPALPQAIVGRQIPVTPQPQAPTLGAAPVATPDTAQAAPASENPHQHPVPVFLPLPKAALVPDAPRADLVPERISPAFQAVMAELAPDNAPLPESPATDPVPPAPTAIAAQIPPDPLPIHTLPDAPLRLDPAPTVTTTPLPTTPAGPLVPVLVAEVRAQTNDTVELALAPEELGRLRMSLQAEGDVMRVHLVAERPETLDLLRRHADVLTQEFRQAGYSGAQLSFGDWGGGDRAAPSSPPPQWEDTPGPATIAHAPPVVWRNDSTGLDLRL